MSVQFRCPACGESFEADAPSPGVVFNCSRCKTPMAAVLTKKKKKRRGLRAVDWVAVGALSFVSLLTMIFVPHFFPVFIGIMILVLVVVAIR